MMQNYIFSSDVAISAENENDLGTLGTTNSGF